MSSKICTKCLTNTKTYATHTEQKPRLKAGVLNPKDFDKIKNKPIVDRLNQMIQERKCE